MTDPQASDRKDPYAEEDEGLIAPEASAGASAAADPRRERIERSEALDGERTISPVSNRFGGKVGQQIGMVALLAVGGMLAYATLSSGDTSAAERKEREKAPPAGQVVQFEGSDGPLGTPPPLPPPPGAGVQDGAQPVMTDSGPVYLDGPSPQPQQVSYAQEGPPQAAPVDPRLALAQSAQRAPLLAYSANRNRGPGQYAGGPAPIGMAEARPSRGDGEGNQLDSLRRGSVIDEVRARQLPDRNLLITAGTIIPCVLQTAMDTSTPGYVTCIIPRDVYSDNGNVVLLEKGTKVLGEYSAGLRRGQRRLFVLWNRAVTPGGVAIDIGSPASDALGRAGFDGQVDNRFWERFGGALLLSLVDDAVAVAAENTSRAQSTVRLPSDAAGIALENSINIPPTLRKRQGSEVAITVSRDFNFSSVYALRRR